MRTEGEELDVDENEEAAEEWDHYFDDIEATKVSFAEYSTKAAVWSADKWYVRRPWNQVECVV